MKANKIKITTLIDGSKQFKIPIYQRTYDWTDKQCDQIWDDIIRIGKSEKEEHFLGAIVYKEEGTQGAGETKKFLIIDGQQRITTVLLLIVALVRHVESDSNSPLSDKIQSIRSQFMINDKKEDERHKLVLTKNDRETLASIIDGREPPSDKSQRITDVFDFFHKKIQEMENLEVAISGISKLSFIDIILERDDDPQHIFESINSTGLKLAQTDLIRNFVFMKMDSEQQNRVYRDYWAPMENHLRHRTNKAYFDRFVRDYLTINLEEIPDKDDVYDRFKYHLENKNVEDVIKEMSGLSGLYERLLFPDCGPEETREAIANINRLKSDVTYPFLLRIYSDLKKGAVRMPDVIKIVRMIESYVFRRWMCSLPSNALNKIFARLSHENPADADYAGKVAVLLATMGGTGTFPDDDKFKSSFYTKEAYKSQSNLRYMLERLENHGHEEDGRLVIDKSITIEHIMPATLGEGWKRDLGKDWENVYKKYLNTVGNLTIICPRSNSAMGNARFLEKRDGPGGYKNSRFVLNAELCRQDRWTESEIHARAESLYEKAADIWRYPAVDPDMLAKHMEAKGGESDDDEESSENWEQRFENSRVQDRINHVISLLEQKFDCIKGGKSRWLYLCTSEPLESKTAFVVLSCGVDTARMSFRVNPETFGDDEKVIIRKNWFFSKGGERSIHPLDMSDEELLRYAEHAYSATKAYLDKRV